MSTEEIEVKAKTLGWVTKEAFRGDESQWIDAETFVQRGEEIMPILRQNNKELSSQLATIKEQLKASQESITELKNFNSAMARKDAAAQKSELVSQIAAAREAGDVVGEEALREQLVDHNAALKTAERTKEPEVKTVDPAIAARQAEMAAWQAVNPWFGQDDVKTGLANGIAAKLRKDGSPLQGRAFFDEVSKQVEAFSAPPVQRASKVEGGRGTGQGGGTSSTGKSFAELPADAKEACERFMKRDITIGKGRAFETSEAFRQHYAKTYFERE